MSFPFLSTCGVLSFIFLCPRSVFFSSHKFRNVAIFKKNFNRVKAREKKSIGQLPQNHNSRPGHDARDIAGPTN